MKMSKVCDVFSTKDYDAFEMHPFNRPIHENDTVEKSMRRVGFMPSKPLQCVKSGKGKLKIICGHHRFSIAKKLGIPVCFVIDDSNVDMYELEGSSTSAWNTPDFAVARARGGDVDVQAAIEFREKHGLTLGSALSLMMGQSAGSGNAAKILKTGTFQIGDTQHAETVVRITDLLREKGVSFATSSAFIAAVSLVVRIPELDYAQLVHRFTMYSHILSKRGTAQEYLEEIEALYNHNSRKKLFPVAIRAKEVSRERSAAGVKRPTA